MELELLDNAFMFEIVFQLICRLVPYVNVAMHDSSIIFILKYSLLVELEEQWSTRVIEHLSIGFVNSVFLYKVYGQYYLQLND